MERSDGDGHLSIPAFCRISLVCVVILMEQGLGFEDPTTFQGSTFYFHPQMQVMSFLLCSSYNEPLCAPGAPAML